MNDLHFILATAGHVDHGKSSLVKALTGIDPDRLPEEKARGITIDLGFAHLDLHTTVSNQSRTLHLGIVDVPGHEDFVKNMVAGVGSIDLALLVVAADDNWMPQTEEHLQILAYLGLKNAVVVLTKIDLVPDAQASISAVRAKLADSPFANAPVIPTSILTGQGLGQLKDALTEMMTQTPPPGDISKPRLSVDRVFTLRGVGTVVTGTLTGGQLRRGQAIMIQPSGTLTRIRTIQSHNKQVELSGPGTRTALNLPDVEATTGVQRGDIITLAELGSPTDTWDVLLEKSGRARNDKSTPARPLKNSAVARLHIGSANFPVNVQLLETKALSPGETALAQIRFELPVFGFVGDRFILRDWAEQATLAGGFVLTVGAQRRHVRSEENLQALRACAQSPGQASIFVQSQLKRDGVALGNALLVQSRFSSEEIAGAVHQLVSEKKAIVLENLVADAKWWHTLQKTATDAIDAAHRAHPEQPGQPLNDLRAALKPHLTWPEVFDVLVRNLQGFTQSGVTIQRATHRPALPAQLQAAGNKLRSALSAKPLDPPSRKELAPDAASQQALRFLVQTGEAVALNEEIVLRAEAVHTAVHLTTALLRKQNSATASELRLALGTSRRVAIPLLEYLDKQGITRREGDKRVLKNATGKP